VGILEAVVFESVRKLAEAQGNAIDPSGDLPCAADALLRTGTITPETREKLVAFQRSIADSTIQEIRAWLAWGQAFLYDHLGAKIVIVN
jgi:hypothetical protein